MARRACQSTCEALLRRFGQLRRCAAEKRFQQPVAGRQRRPGLGLPDMAEAADFIGIGGKLDGDGVIVGRKMA